jgi:hypothetical protein
MCQGLDLDNWMLFSTMYYAVSDLFSKPLFTLDKLLNNSP